MRNTRGIDKWLLWTTILLVVYGFLIFASASQGLLVSDGQSTYLSVVFRQFFLGIVGGFIFLSITQKISYQFWKKYALYIFVFSVILTSLVFIPPLGYSHGGATRWLDLGGFSFQPAEFLKVAFVIYFAAWATNVKKNIRTFKYGLLPLGVMLGISGTVLLLQPDTDTLVIMACASIGMFLIAGGKWGHFLGIIFVGVLASFVLIFTVPYIQHRIDVFLNPGSNLQGSGYQIHQSLIAVSSGELFGRGFGQSVQKFGYLPEPNGDSIFAVLAEELGFLGSSVLVLLYGFFALRGFLIASRSRDMYGRLLAVGIVLLITSQAFLNIASMVRLFPIAGLPLPFVSQGGSAMFMMLGMVGILLNISKQNKTKTRSEHGKMYGRMRWLYKTPKRKSSI